MNEKAAYQCAPVLCFRGNNHVLHTVFPVVPHEEHSRHIYLHKCDDPWYLGVVCVLFSFTQVALNIICTQSTFSTSGISPLSS